eukprot:TRINITY_DN14832_c0_g1_i1.p1 TRINITY_DN14832_c0_g1~~TRINITY_DN14832_c0_g1_i1.p1  ORF type:complete len:411 (-),score=89.41 TRINITY_DN14832_c0_g1_i1:6-1238(-)
MYVCMYVCVVLLADSHIQQSWDQVFFMGNNNCTAVEQIQTVDESVGKLTAPQHQPTHQGGFSTVKEVNTTPKLVQNVESVPTSPSAVAKERPFFDIVDEVPLARMLGHIHTPMITQVPTPDRYAVIGPFAVNSMYKLRFYEEEERKRIKSQMFPSLAHDPKTSIGFSIMKGPKEDADLSEEETDKLAESTKLSKTMIRRIHKEFINCTNIYSHETNQFVLPEPGLRAILKLKNFYLSQRLFHVFNHDDPIGITFPEFTKLVSQISESAPDADKIKLSFIAFDIDHDEQLSPFELQLMLESALNQHGVQLDPSLVSHIIQNTIALGDKNGDDLLDFEEYTAMVHLNPRFLQAFTFSIDSLFPTDLTTSNPDLPASTPTASDAKQHAPPDAAVRGHSPSKRSSHVLCVDTTA